MHQERAGRGLLVAKRPPQRRGEAGSRQPRVKGCGSGIYFVNRGVVEHMLNRLDSPSHKCSSYIAGYFPFRCMGNRVPLLVETECCVFAALDPDAPRP